MRKIATIFFCFFNLFVLAQESNLKENILKGNEANNYLSGSELVRFYAYTQVPSYIKFRGNSSISESQGEAWLTKFAKLAEEGGLKLIRKEADELGYTHYRFVQMYKGYEIFGTTYILHFRNGFLVSANGLLYDHVSKHRFSY